jgi:NAD+ kinase
MKLGIVANYTHRRTPEIVKKIISWCEDNGVEFAPDDEVSTREGFKGKRLTEKAISSLDAVISIGGDGTILATSGLVSGSGTPILGINVGGLGFLTLATADNYISYLKRLLKGDYVVQERMMLEVRVENVEGEKNRVFHALNDAVVYKGAFSRIVQLKIDVGDEEVGVLQADGIIISTPTGSTGYSLSSGGPLVLPVMEVILVTPICPHTLGARPLVIPSDRRVSIEVVSSGIELALTVDGQKGTILHKGSIITVSKSTRTTSVVRIQEGSFFALLRSKLGWIAREE